MPLELWQHWLMACRALPIARTPSTWCAFQSWWDIDPVMRYMNSLSIKIRMLPDGAVTVDGLDVVSPVIIVVSFLTYYAKWEKNSQLKVSHPAEDICQHCFAVANQHRYLATHIARTSLVNGNASDDTLWQRRATHSTLPSWGNIWHHIKIPFKV